MHTSTGEGGAWPTRRGGFSGTLVERGISPVGRTVSMRGLITTGPAPEGAGEWSEDGGAGEDTGWDAGAGGNGAPALGGALRVHIVCGRMYACVCARVPRSVRGIRAPR